MNEYTLSDNASSYLDYFFKGNPDRDTGMYATIYNQVKEATEGPYKDPQELLGLNLNEYR